MIPSFGNLKGDFNEGYNGGGGRRARDRLVWLRSRLGGPSIGGRCYPGDYQPSWATHLNCSAAAAATFRSIILGDGRFRFGTPTTNTIVRRLLFASRPLSRRKSWFGLSIWPCRLKPGPKQILLEDREGHEMKHPPPPGGKLDLTRDEFQALRDVKVGKPTTPEMQARLTKLKLAAQTLGGFSLTNDGELRLAHGK